jgi:2-polyprenyl-3-methyl-5-hydroxy-6-metoxy-1,4-benzoquinol methylase
MLARCLNIPWIWNSCRWGMDKAFGLYSSRIALMRRWGLSDPRLSVLDIGCGTGQLAQITEGEYLGIDLDPQYIQNARRLHQRDNVKFECADVASVRDAGRKFDLILMIDILHHLPDASARSLLHAVAAMSSKYVFNSEPVHAPEQTNPLARWVVSHDRGRYMRSSEELRGLYQDAGLTILQHERRCTWRLPINGWIVLAQPGGEERNRSGDIKEG